MTPLPPTSAHPGQLPGEPEPTWLDQEHIMEPLEAADPLEVPASDPVVVDAAGRMWRVRYRPAWIGSLTRAAPVLLGVVLLVLLLVLRV